MDGNLVPLFRDTYVRETWIYSASGPRWTSAARVAVTVPPHGEWVTELDVLASDGEQHALKGRRPAREHGRGGRNGLTVPTCSATGSREHITPVPDRPGCAAVLHADHARPLAVLPGFWFMTIFGRDSTSPACSRRRSSPTSRDNAASTGRTPGQQVDDFRDEDPGGSARDALRRLHGVRGTAVLAVLRQRRRHAAVRGAA